MSAIEHLPEGEPLTASPASESADGRSSLSGITSIVAELGLRVTEQGTVVRGWVDVVEEACIPLTHTLRTSVIATWADVVAGAVAGEAMSPRIPLTLDLEVLLFDTAKAGERLVVEAVMVKAGRTIVVSQATFTTEQGRTVAVALASFIASPDPTHLFPGGFPSMLPVQGRLLIPLAERIGAESIAPGIAEVPHRPDGLNATGAIQGGLVIMAAEEAAISLAEGRTVPYSLNLRYLRPFSIGPCRAEATGDAIASVVRLTDIGSGKISAIATVRLGPA